MINNKRLVIEVSNGKVVADYPSGAVGFMSYTRLRDILKASGETHRDERITHFAMGDDGIIIRYETLK